MDRQLLTALQTAMAHWKEGPVGKTFFWCRFCKCAMGRHDTECIVPSAQEFLAEHDVESNSFEHQGDAPSLMSRSAVPLEHLVMEHLPQVHSIARRLHSRVPQQIQLEDLVNAGIVGLLEAINHYDPSRGVKLMTFAKQRIEGAMLDSLRDLDWSPRELRKKGRQVEQVMSTLHCTLGRPPCETEIASEMGITLEGLQNLLCDLRVVDLYSLEALAASSEQDDQIYNYIPTSREEDPLFLCLKSELHVCLTQAVSELPERERQVLALYYIEELTMKEVGAVLGVGEVRVSQVHSAALLRLRGRLQELLSSHRTFATPVDDQPNLKDRAFGPLDRQSDRPA